MGPFAHNVPTKLRKLAERIRHVLTEEFLLIAAIVALCGFMLGLNWDRG
jgi:hypothetical protein